MWLIVLCEIGLNTNASNTSKIVVNHSTRLESQNSTQLTSIKSAMPSDIGTKNVYFNRVANQSRGQSLWYSEENRHGILRNECFGEYQCPVEIRQVAQNERGSSLIAAGYALNGATYGQLREAMELSNPFVHVTLMGGDDTAQLDEDDNWVILRVIGVGGARKKTTGQQRPQKKRQNRAPPSTKRSPMSIPLASLRQMSVPRTIKPARKAPGLSRGLSGPRLSKCVLKTGLAIIDPFNPAARGCCLPTAPAIPSQKVHCLLRGDAIIGTGGVGFIAVSPTVGNDCVVAYFTTGTFTRLTTHCLESVNFLGTGITALIPNTLPYTTAQLVGGTQPSQVSGRVVSCGVKLFYTGTELNMSGLTYCYETPTHYSAVTTPNVGNAITASQLAQNEECAISDLNRTPCTLNMFPKSDAEMEYGPLASSEASLGGGMNVVSMLYPYSGGNTKFNNGYTYSAAGNDAGCPIGTIMFTGVAGMSVHFEIILHVEYTGLLTAGRTTEEAADVAGLQKVLSAAQHVVVKKTRGYSTQVFDGSKMWAMFVESLKEVGKETLKVAVPMAYTAIATLLA